MCRSHLTAVKLVVEESTLLYVFSFPEIRFKRYLVSACANRCVSEALIQSGVRLAEPVMKLEVNVQVIF